MCLFNGSTRNPRIVPWWTSRGPFWTIHHNTQDFGVKILVAFITQGCLTFLLQLWHLPKDWTYPRAKFPPSYSHHPYCSLCVMRDKICRPNKPPYSFNMELLYFSCHRLHHEVDRRQGSHKQHNNCNCSISFETHHHQIWLPFGVNQWPRGPVHQWNYWNVNYEIHDKPQERHTLRC